MKKEDLQKLYSKYKIIIFPVLVGFSGIILMVLVIIPQLKGYLSRQEDAKQVKNRLEILDVKAKDLENLSEADLQRKLQSAVSALPTTKDYTSVIGLIQRLSAQSGVTLKTVSLDTGRGASSSEANSFAVSTEITSSKAGFDQFLKSIEAAPLVMKVASIEISSSGGADSVTASIVIDVYYSPTPKNLGSVDSPLPKLSQEEENLALDLVSKVAIIPASSPVTSPGSEIPLQPPANILPRGKANPFE